VTTKPASTSAKPKSAKPAGRSRIDRDGKAGGVSIPEAYGRSPLQLAMATANRPKSPVN
jgi:hypothetical protein